MNKVPILILFSLSLLSCSQQAADNSAAAGTFLSEDSWSGRTDTSTIPVNANYPFGCDDLKKFSYPKHWESDSENHGHLNKAGEHVFEAIGKCFNAINTAKTIKGPRPQKVELLEIGDIFKNAYNLDSLMQQSVDSCRYRLRDIGIYECYYSYQHYGNLILLNPKTNEAKLLNIYADDLGCDGCTNLRYFYLDKNELRIYEAACYDDGCTLDEKYTIIINPHGRIDIRALN